MWRFGGVADPHAPMIWGRKLRFDPEIRRRGLHLMLNLVALDGARADRGAAHFYRVALVNMLGFQALRPALAEAWTPPLPRELDSPVDASLAAAMASAWPLRQASQAILRVFNT